ncbi:sulfite exporter TauE/SafE family protein [Shewanella colwelliana]|uniref:Probable membrane transporter protein n=1 Tax=Shewanella colwelliana TaxID=23 RepID=A0A1E5IQV1_SHECO|nr:sulfite exporter TauE/SafE family protein [Shewanella colwelliana]MDX1280566.1 sulfite exporter TauE/SafE family protein [Shewanella colwelliana]OEG72847.1 hypothetical protein BEL05_11295 [Shewanella colwelliana]
MIKTIAKIKQLPAKYQVLILLLITMWGIWLSRYPDTFGLLSNYLQYSLLGITGAIFANATGAGGGVIFIPVFNNLSFSAEQSIATSFAIQCFGMTAGALTWRHHYKTLQQTSNLWSQLPTLLLLCTPLSIMGLWTTLTFELPPPSTLEHSFSLFSIILGLAIIYSSSKLKPNACYRRLGSLELVILGVFTYLGGIITAWLSVGVGEIIVIYLMLRRVDPTLAVATGVIVTAMTVWTTSFIHFGEHSDAYFNVVLFAGPGAVIGGILAKKLALYLPVKRLKLFFASWIILSGVAMLLIQ